MKTEQTNIEYSTKACKTFQTHIDKFIVSLSVEKNASKHTQRNYQIDLECFNMWADRMELDPLTVTYRQFRGFLSDLDNDGYARTTINRKLSSLRTFFKWLDVTGVASNNFASVIQGPKIPKSLPTVVRSNEIKKIFDVCKNDLENARLDAKNNTISGQKKISIACRDWALIEVMYATGARISEIADLKIENVNCSQSQIKLLGKGNKERVVPVYQAAMSSLRTYIDQHRIVLLGDNCANSVVSDYVFISNTGKHMSADSIRKMFSNKCREAGVSANIHPHSMRHTFATDVLDGGADLRSVQEMLGHVSLSTTQIYTHLSTKKLKDVHSQAHPRG